MATFREKIEAVLKARDAGRFKSAMNVAAKAVEHFERQEEHATVQSELLEHILGTLETQSMETTAAIMLLSHSVNDMGDEMLAAAAASTVADRAMKKSGSNAVFLGKSWAFWKDRLSLTRSELMTTAMTIGAYLSPALIALGSSFTYAAVGGGAVAGAGMASFVAGLLSIKTIAGPVFDGISKIKKAQDQYNLAVDQYGVLSIQTSRASAHMYAVIQNNGGQAVAEILGKVEDLRDAWKELTKVGRDDVIGMMGEGVATGTKLAPLAASLSNQMVHSLRGAWTDALKDLSGGQAQKTMRALADIFQGSAGHGIRAGVNVIMIFGRVIRAAAPWVKRFAASWENVTDQWRKKATLSAVTKFLNEAVNHTRAWWGLIKAVGRVILIVIEGSRKQGAGLVVQITAVVNKFADWLELMKNTGQIDAFFRSYMESMKQVVWALQNPMQALDQYMPAIVAGIDTYLPQVMDAIANTLATHGPTAAGIFLKAFVDAGAWAKFLTIAFFMTKFGFMSKLGAWAAGIFLKPFAERFVAGFSATMAIEGAAGGRIATAMGAAGTASGKAFGKGIMLGALTVIPALTYEFQMAIINSIGPLKKFYDSLGKGGKHEHLLDPKGLFDNFWKTITPRGKASGGMIFPGQTSLVGEHGPEVAKVSAGGAMITPGDRVQPRGNSIVDIPDISSAIRLISNVSVQVDKREIARAVDDQRAYDSARRGQG